MRPAAPVPEVQTAADAGPAAFIARKTDRWRNVIVRSNIKVE